MPDRRVTTDERRARRLRRRDWARDFWLLAVTAILFWAAWAGEQEADTRQDQVCVVFERLHDTEVRRLRGTYEYLAALPSAELETVLSQTILRGLPETEKRVEDILPPAFCNQPGVGLPEPGLKTPERPPSLRVPPRP